MPAYNPETLQIFLDELESGAYDDPNTTQPGQTDDTPPPPPPPPTGAGTQGANGELDVDEFLYGNDAGTAQPQNTETQTTQPTQPAFDPVEMQRQLLIAQGKLSVYEGMSKPTQPQTTPEQPPARPDFVYDPESVALTEDESKLIAQSRPLVEKLTKAILNDVYKTHIKPLHDQIDQQRAHAQAVEQQIANDRARKFYNDVHVRLPDLKRIAATPEFASYLKQPAPRSGGAFTVEQELMTAIQYGNMEAVVEIVSGYKPSHPQPGVQNVAPGRPQAGTPPTVEKGSKILPYSKFLNAQRLFENGMMTHDAYLKVQDAFKNAELDGRVDYNS